MKTVLSLYGLVPKRVGGMEALVRETTLQLADRGWQHVAAFAGPPSEAARAYLSHPNLKLEVVREPWAVTGETLQSVRELLSKYRPDVFHFLYRGVIGPYPWLATMYGVRRILFTDQGSYPEDFQASRASIWKRIA